MTRIDPTLQLQALMSAQVAALRNRSAERPSAKDTRARLQPGDAKDATEVAARRAKALPADDPQRERKAFRIFLEAVLLTELGAELANDPAFSTMVDDVHRQMEADATLAPALALAAQQLLGPGSA